MSEEGTFRRLSPAWGAVVIVLSVIGLGLSVLQIFLLKPFGFMLIENAYYYSLMGFYISLVFLIFPAGKSIAQDRIPWYDYGLFFLCAGISFYYASSALEIIHKGWELRAPLLPTILSIFLWLMVVEAVRRATGMVLAVVCGFFSLYPLFAGSMPGFLEGAEFGLWSTSRYHAMSTVSMLGIPMQVVGSLLVGFVLFGVALQATGGGKFFLDFAFALMGGARGGPAKVSVISSALFGTMSGSVISNVLVDGPFTIPAMKKAGYPAHYAGAIEAVTSTGGALMPPVMGASAFVMASFLGIPYAKVALSAAVPAILYYAALFFQVDAYARRMDLKGMSKSELPSLWRTLKEGWFFCFALLALIILIFFLKNEAQAPFYAMLILFFCAMLRAETRVSGKGFLQFLADCGKIMAQLTAILAGIGLVIGSLSMTGIAHSFSRDLVAFAGGSVSLLLLMGALTSFILGMGMTAVACYIFLAITLAPALVNLGLNPIAVHLFVLYWGLVSFITPPVALGAITAAPIAGAGAMQTGYAAMRLGSSIYFVPFFFVLNPALILIGSGIDIVLSVVTAFIGIYFISGGLEGYIFGLGRVGFFLRIPILAAGFFIAAPYRLSELIGLVILIPSLGYGYWQRRKANRSTQGEREEIQNL
jgi:TRAP transporter 4TM/12TM fusion protein